MEDLEQNLIDADEITEIELLKRSDLVRKAATIYRKYVFAEEIISKRSKTFLAKLKMEIKSTIKEKVSNVDLETLAMATESWEIFDKKNINALLRAGEAELDYKVAMVEYEAMRSALSSRKEEIKSLKG